MKVYASVILRKLAAYPRQNGLALALRELGKLERTFFTLQWLQDPELRRRSHVGLNKGEQQNALRRAVFLNLLVAAISLWNTTYLQRAIAIEGNIRNRMIDPSVATRLGAH